MLELQSAFGKLAPLNKVRLLPAEPIRFALAVVAGLMWAAAFPRANAAVFAWLAPGLMLFAGLGVSGSTAFRLGYIAGLVNGLATLYWLLHIPVNKLAPFTGWLALSAYVALFPATWVWFCSRTFKVGQASRLPSLTLPPGAGGTPALLFSLDTLLAAGLGRRLAWAFGCAACWVALEMVRVRLFSGFPWNLLGVSQYEKLALVQFAAWTGVYGVSFLIVWFSVSLLGAVAVVFGRSAGANGQWWTGDLVLPLLALVVASVFGLRQLVAEPLRGPTLKVALVQPSIPQRWIWDPNESAKRFEQLLELSRQALTNRPDLVVWPEAAVPSFVRWNTNINRAVRELARAHGTWLILGSDDLAPAAAPRYPDATDVFNSSFLVRPDGEFVATYRKRKLVIFGEYLPLGRYWPWLERVTGLGSFSPGKEPVAFTMPDLRAKTSVLICFEDVFPHVAREHVDPDTDFLLNLTNNGWFGESAAQWQHAASAVFRAIENGLPLVRCANNGLSCWVDARGRPHEVYLPGTRDIYGPGVKLANVPLLGDGPRQPTFYSRHGDWFGWGCVASTALSLGLLFTRRHKIGIE